jgi:hypothetical protein
MKYLVLRYCLLGLLIGSMPLVLSAQTANCVVLVHTSSPCPFDSHCLINTNGLINADTGVCGSNVGATIPCSEGCGGGSVFTASVNGLACLPRDGCQNGDVVSATNLIHQGHIGRVYAIGCNGEMRVFLAANRSKATATRPAEMATIVAPLGALKSR